MRGTTTAVVVICLWDEGCIDKMLTVATDLKGDGLVNPATLDTVVLWCDRGMPQGFEPNVQKKMMKMRESQAEHMPSPWSHQDLVLELGRSNISSVSR